MNGILIINLQNLFNTTSGKQLSIVKPLPNGSFQILTEIDLENGNVSNIDHSLLVSVDPKALEISIFDAVN